MTLQSPSGHENYSSCICNAAQPPFHPHIGTADAPSNAFIRPLHRTQTVFTEDCYDAEQKSISFVSSIFIPITYEFEDLLPPHTTFSENENIHIPDLSVSPVFFFLQFN